MHTREFTARGRALGAELRAWRERAGLEGVELARMLSWSGTKVSNMETGRRGVSEVDAAMYLACCRTPGTAIEKILEFFHEQQEYWVQPHGLLADVLRSLITLETTAAVIQGYEPAVIQARLESRCVAATTRRRWRMPRACRWSTWRTTDSASSLTVPNLFASTEKFLPGWRPLLWMRDNHDRGLPRGQTNTIDQEGTTMSVSNSRSRPWRRSTFSDGTGQSNCVEIAPTPGAMSARDSKNLGGGELTFPAAAWHSFLLTLTQ